MKMNRQKLLASVKNFSGGLVIGIALALAMGLTLSRLGSQRADYAALFIALAGFVFTMWWDSYKDSKSENQARIALLSYLKLELTQTKNSIKSIINIVNEKGEEGFLPAPLHSQAWQSAIASPFFISLSTTMQEELTSIYGRVDVANRYADIINTLDYSPSVLESLTAVSSKRARGLYLTVIRQLDKQVSMAISQIDIVLGKGRTPSSKPLKGS